MMAAMDREFVHVHDISQGMHLFDERRYVFGLMAAAGPMGLASAFFRIKESETQESHLEWQEPVVDSFTELFVRQVQ